MKTDKNNKISHFGHKGKGVHQGRHVFEKRRSELHLGPFPSLDHRFSKERGKGVGGRALSRYIRSTTVHISHALSFCSVQQCTRH